MITLTFESTAKVASVAVSDGERILASYSINNGLTQSELLLPMAEAAMRSLGLRFDDVELLGCSVGPGSFTGVRIGTALVKGIAFGRNIPCASVSTLEALAENLAGLEGIIVPVIDARRSQVYCAIFEYRNGEMIRHTEDMAKDICELGTMLKSYCDKTVYLVGDGYGIAKRKLTELSIPIADTPEALRDESAASVAKVAVRMYKNGKVDTDLTHNPTYLRMPQAERERLARLNETK